VVTEEVQGVPVHEPQPALPTVLLAREHLSEGVLRGHADAVLAASIFHYGEFTVRQAKEHMARLGIEVRI